MARQWRQQKKKAVFLEAYAEIGTITHAAMRAQVDRTTIYRWRDSDPVFAAALDEADLMAAERLEQEARRRAVDGVEKPVWHKGQMVGSVREYSDTLLIFLLKGALPDKYRERVSSEISGQGGGPLQVTVQLDDKLRDWSE